MTGPDVGATVAFADYARDVEALRKQLAGAQATVEALQRERDTARRRVDELEAREVDVVLLRGDLDDEREKAKGQTQRAEYAEGKVRELLLKQDAFELRLLQLQAAEVQEKMKPGIPFGAKSKNEAKTEANNRKRIK